MTYLFGYEYSLFYLFIILLYYCYLLMILLLDFPYFQYIYVWMMRKLAKRAK